MTKTSQTCTCPRCHRPAFEVWERVPGGNARFADCVNCDEKYQTYFESHAEAAETRAELAVMDAREAAWHRANGGAR